MSDKKISQLTSLAQGDVVVSTDVLPIVDTSATETKKIAVNALVGAAAAAGLTNVDINSGTIDGTTIATSDITVGSGKTLNVSAGTLTLADNQISGDKVEGGTINAITINTLTSTAVNATTVDATNVEVTNIKAKDGTAAATIADSTGIVSLSANPILSGGTANGVLYLNGSKVATSGSALTFDGGANLSTGGSNAGTYNTLNVNNTSATGYSRLLFNIGSSGANGVGSIKYAPGIFFAIGTDSDASSTPITFNLNGSEQMRLTSTGLGIGTSSPGAKLDVEGANTSDGPTRFTANLRNSGAQTIGVGTGIAFSQKMTGFNAVLATVEGIKENATTDNYASALVFSTRLNGNNLAERARIDSSGNLGIGVTPSAWGGGFAVAQYKGGFIGSQSNAYLYTGQNAFFDGINYKYIATAAATAYEQTAGKHIWYNAASGTAGNNISWTQAMTLEASGKLSLGTTGNDGNAGYGNITINGTNGSLLDLRDGDTLYARVRAEVNEMAVLSQGASSVLVLGTNNTERARITSGGYFKASDNGTYANSTGTYHEHYQSANDLNTVVRSANASLTSNILVVQATRDTTNNSYYPYEYYNTGAAATRFRVADSGDVTNTNGTYGTISDAKMKTDIVDAGSQWADLKAVRFRKFKMKNDPSGLMQLGVVAQELEQTSPGLVDEHTDRDAEGNDLGTTTKSVKTSVLLMKAAVALQEAMARIEKLEAEMAALKGA